MYNVIYYILYNVYAVLSCILASFYFGEFLFWRILWIREIRQNKTLANISRYTVSVN